MAALAKRVSLTNAVMENDTSKWKGMLYDIRKEFDAIYVQKDGVYKLLIGIVFSGAAIILSSFFLGLAAFLLGKIHL